MRKSTIIFSLCLLLSLTGWTQQEVKAQTATLRVTYEYPGLSLPFLVALDRGLFEENGIKVQARKLTGEGLNFGATDIITGHGFYIIQQRKAGPNVISFTQPIAITKDGDMVKGFLVKNLAQIKTFADLSGKTVVAGDFGILEWQEGFGHATKAHLTGGRVGGGLGAALAHAGKAGDIDILVGDLASATFPHDESAHAIYGFALLIRKWMRDEPTKYSLIASNLECEYISNPYFVATTYINIRAVSDKKDALRRYLKAVDAAIEYIRENPKEALSVLSRYYPKLKQEDAQLIGVYKFYKSTEQIDKNALEISAGGSVMDYLYQP